MRVTPWVKGWEEQRWRRVPEGQDWRGRGSASPSRDGVGGFGFQLLGAGENFGVCDGNPAEFHSARTADGGRPYMVPSLHVPSPHLRDEGVGAAPREGLCI